MSNQFNNAIFNLFCIISFLLPSLQMFGHRLPDGEDASEVHPHSPALLRHGAPLHPPRSHQQGLLRDSGRGQEEPAQASGVVQLSSERRREEDAGVGAGEVFPLRLQAPGEGGHLTQRECAEGGVLWAELFTDGMF